MIQKDRAKKVLIAMAAALGVMVWMMGFSATYSRTQQSSSRIVLSILGGLVFLAIAFSVIFAVCKIVGWAVRGFRVDEDGDDLTDDDPVNLKGGCRRAALVLAGIVAICGAVFAVSIPIGEYLNAKDSLELFESQTGEYQGKAIYDYMQRERIRDNYWLNLSKGALTGLCICAGLAGAIASFTVVWVLYRFFEQLIVNIFTDK
jgi:hypothetical protein